MKKTALAALALAVVALSTVAAFAVGNAVPPDMAAVSAVAPTDIVSTLDYWWGVLGKIVIVASGLSATIPAPSTGSPIGVVFKVLNWAALNIWHAKNAPPSA